MAQTVSESLARVAESEWLQPHAAHHHTNRTSGVCGWAGNAGSDARNDGRNPLGLFRPVRGRFVAAAHAHPDLFEVVDTAMPSDTGFAPRARNFVSVADQVAKWACLVDLRGAGFSVRVPLLLWSGRPLLFIERPGLQTFHEAVSFPRPWKAWVHYVPVSEDLHDLALRAKWVLSHHAEAARIAANALGYARCFLTTRYARRHAAREALAAAACAAPCAELRQRCSACMRSSVWRAAYDRAAWLVEPEDGSASGSGCRTNRTRVT